MLNSRNDLLLIYIYYGEAMEQRGAFHYNLEHIKKSAKEKHFFILKLQRKWGLDGGITEQRAVKQKS